MAQKIQLDDESFLLKTEYDMPELFDRLLEFKPKEKRKIKIWGKLIDMPRFQKTFGMPYAFSGVMHKADPIPDCLLPLFDFANNQFCQGFSGKFNSCLVNYYEKGDHYISAHSDDESSLVPLSPIFSLSLGQERIFRMRDKKTRAIVADVPTKNNTVLVMCGHTQSRFTHEVPKTAKKVGERISITLRMMKE